MEKLWRCRRGLFVCVGALHPSVISGRFPVFRTKELIKSLSAQHSDWLSLEQATRTLVKSV